MSTLRGILISVCLLALSSQSFAVEYLIFKRIDQDLGIDSLPFKYTVWHTDAAQAVAGPINATGLQIADPEARIAYFNSQIEAVNKKKLGLLFLMGFSAVAKMQMYGLSKTPSAVLLDDDGSVIEKWDGFGHGSDLYFLEETK